MTSLRRLGQLALRPLERFFQIEAASGILLLVAAAVALVWASSPWTESYQSLWYGDLELGLAGRTVTVDLAWVVNDVLMVIFFFVVGLEIRRELYEGALADWKRASLPALAALGGMVVPAGLYLLVAGAAPIRAGWGVPMATDIAFAIGILTLLGRRVPAALRVLLLAVAVIDDLGAILVIAVFYSSGVDVIGLLVAAAALAAIVGLQRLGVTAKLAYLVPAVALWGGVYAAGIHPTIAGVILGLVTPVRAAPGEDSPSAQLVATLHPWVAFAIMPTFALANAGVVLGGVSLDQASWQVVLGAGIGLVVGKPIGILVASGLAVRLGVSALPAGLGLRHLMVLGAVAGIGFTMALFVAQLAFADPTLLAAAKLGVLAGSGGAALIGLGLGRVLLAPGPRRDDEPA